ncbi:DUF5107 domain-containing protein [Longimycelium tulufanense]|uniref:DUF5107 domain-containing protein n=1 Tax=Longimycelium tulufanense TaxID=907463 RepID=UPI001663C03D|nr:DUF5107 domain-containing protein [Longimycelium tulufanense]
MGPENPLPPLAGMLDPPYKPDFSEVPDEIENGARYGQVSTVVPYLVQDGYQRSPEMTTTDAVVLENARLRATFLPGWGGRLWSLIDKDRDRELLHVPAIVQPANLALRGAWFPGGVEWNIGTRGHSPFTCDPVHAAVVAHVGGPVLRMWEYERIRGVVFQIDAWLPEDSPVLLVGVRIRNPSLDTVPMYWWSNAAVAQRDDLRVLAPATRAFRTSYRGQLECVNVPLQVGEDASRPLRARTAADYFYDLPAESSRPWIAALDTTGYGLAQISTPFLSGRKLFVWGETVGGRHWQEWLGGPHPTPYCEIQAGLTRTQYEHLPMPPEAEWAWVEAYGPVTAEPNAVHGADWSAALAAVEDVLPRRELLDGAFAEFRKNADQPPQGMLGHGSGWGALEEIRRERAGEAPLCGPGAPFGGTLGPAQWPWLTLVDTGELPEPAPEDVPVSYILGADWSSRLMRSPQHWATCYHLGVIAHAGGDLETARRYYETSLVHVETAWAWRALALVDSVHGGKADAVEGMLAAHTLAPGIRQLAVEAAEALMTADEPKRALQLIAELPATVAGHGRVRLTRVRAALAAGLRDEAARLLRGGIEVPDLREGEVSLDQLWAEACPGEPLPTRYDFRMK